MAGNKEFDNGHSCNPDLEYGAGVDMSGWYVTRFAPIMLVSTQERHNL